MRRNAEDLSTRFRDVVAGQSEDAIAEFLEDLNDSVTEVPDTTNLIERSEYDKVVGERDAALESARSYRDRYINRFYQPRNDASQQDYVVSETPQKTIERDEYDVSYEDLYE